MNVRGSWRRLLGNAMSAMLGAIEIYNKPRFAYRDEVFVILLINSWELLLKAIVSKSGGRIYYPKKRGEPYRTLTCRDAFWRAAHTPLWPKKIPFGAVDANIELISVYRDQAIHFYNNRSFGAVIYSLSQTSIINFRDVAEAVFGRDIGDEMGWRIMPLGMSGAVDPVKFMRGKGTASDQTRAVQDFLTFMQEKTDELGASGVDTGRLCTVFDVSLNSVKKIDKADIVAGVTSEDRADAFIVHRRVDPNASHPFRRKDVLPKLAAKLSAYEFDAVVHSHKLKENPRYCWKDDNVSLVKWSSEMIKYLDNLTPMQITKARDEYASRNKKKKA
ncbi:DUF3644 domain-containing protein [Actinoplanes sp. L3-i22]|uniref:DUF3644 domain-containing protein n=1 Tax=Actinoplanes sp. L3-i22 TaxID=2836373 RepID=UPI001C85A5C5|nr:DUF3644 domain-containing protein [Actinoplanes sp. L3-i22]